LSTIDLIGWSRKVIYVFFGATMVIAWGERLPSAAAAEPLLAVI
jgi:hypothetical protein